MVIVDSAGLAEILKIKQRTLREFWRQLPHFYIGEGRDLRSARFDAEDVVKYLKKRDYDERLVRQEEETLDSEVLVPKGSVPEGGVQNAERGEAVGIGKIVGLDGTAAGRNRHNLAP